MGEDPGAECVRLSVRVLVLLSRNLDIFKQCCVRGTEIGGRQATDCDLGQQDLGLETKCQAQIELEYNLL